MTLLNSPRSVGRRAARSEHRGLLRATASELPGYLGDDAVLPCDFVGAAKLGHGAPRWWCRTHQTDSGTQAQEASQAGAFTVAQLQWDGFGPFPRFTPGPASRAGKALPVWSRAPLLFLYHPRSVFAKQFEMYSPIDPDTLRRVLKGLPNTALLVLAPDAPDFTILEVTDEYLTATLKRREELLGRPVFHVLPDTNPSNPTPTGVKNLRDALVAVLESGLPRHMPVQRYDIATRGGDWEERYWAPQNVPLKTEEGSVQAIIHHVRDVTPEVLGQQAIRRAELAAAQTIERMADAYALLDSEFRFLAVNAAALRALGLSKEDLLGKTHWEVFPASVHLEAGRAYRRAMRDRVEQHLVQHYVGEGFDRHLEIDAYPTDDGGLAIFWRDITHRVVAEAEVREASRRKDVFIATLAHELRNPLAPIRMGMQILKMAPAGSPAATNALEIMERQFHHTVRLLDDLLDVSRISRGKLELRLAPVEMRVLIDQAVEAALPFVEAGRHELVCEVRDPGACLTVDRTRLLQVIGNLLNNAAKFTPPGGMIRLRALVEGGHAVIEVEDNGPGIAQDKLGSIFELFTQLSAVEFSQSGLGIGLSLSRTLVEMHKGSLEAASTGPGEGSRFTVRLPRALGA